MSFEAHLSQLNTKHAELDRQIENEMRAALPDQMRLTKLKRQKLQLKDRMHQFSH